MGSRRRRKYQTLCNLPQLKKPKEAGANKYRGWEPGLEGTGSGKFNPPPPGPLPPQKLAGKKTTPRTRKKRK